ncbi:MAG: hypothetical protein OXC31_10545 [Spirochaetaceae bacterium]|nr:hypothetical protein [Spirochaetaceae bacterium]
MKHLTVRNVPAELARALTEEKTRRGVSLNQAVIDLLRRSLGQGPDAPYDNGLGHLAGDWSEEDLREFETNTKMFEQIDEELWR